MGVDELLDKAQALLAEAAAGLLANKQYEYANSVLKQCLAVKGLRPTKIPSFGAVERG